jgi:hypothetical protein
MPVFECSRCNNLTYSASRSADTDCDVCGGSRKRSLEHAFSFDEAREEPRVVAHGDHVCVWFDEPEQVAPLCVHLIRTGLAEGALVVAYPQAVLAAAIKDQLTEDERAKVDWHESADVYGPGFDPDDVVARFRTVGEAEQRPVYVLGGAESRLDELGAAEVFRRFERLATEVAIDTGMVVVCLYDRSFQPQGHVEAAEETHPLETSGATVKRNEDFVFEGVPG